MTRILPNLLAAGAIIPSSIAICWYLTSLFGPLTLAERQWAQNARLSGARHKGDFAEEQYFAGAIRWHFALAVLTLIATMFVAAPYGGRLGSKDEKSFVKRLCTYSVASVPAWFLQEFPTLVAAGLAILPAFLSWYAWPREMVKFAAAPLYNYFSVAAKVTTFAPLEIFQQYAGVTFYPTILLFLIHYVHRTLIFPFFFEDGKGYLTRWGGEQKVIQQQQRYAEKVIRNTYNDSGVGGTVLENQLISSTTGSRQQLKINQQQRDVENVLNSTYADADNGGRVFTYERTLTRQAATRSNPLLTVALAAAYCALNGCLQVSANIASTTSQLLSPAYVGDIAGNVDAVPQSAWLFFNWPIRSLIRSVGGRDSTAAVGVAASTAHIATTPLEFIFGEFFGFSHVAFPNWFIAGSMLFFVGMWINVTFDYYMFSVASQKKRQASGGYVQSKKSSVSGGNDHHYILPNYPLFRLITAPNYFGELIEWIGYAIALWGASGSSLSFAAGMSFVFYTFCNLAPRAVASKAWYREKFGNLFTTEYALIPYLL